MNLTPILPPIHHSLSMHAIGPRHLLHLLVPALGLGHFLVQLWVYPVPVVLLVGLLLVKGNASVGSLRTTLGGLVQALVYLGRRQALLYRHQLDCADLLVQLHLQLVHLLLLALQNSLTLLKVRKDLVVDLLVLHLLLTKEILLHA